MRIGEWSSDVCSSVLDGVGEVEAQRIVADTPDEDGCRAGPRAGLDDLDIRGAARQITRVPRPNLPEHRPAQRGNRDRRRPKPPRPAPGGHGDFGDAFRVAVGFGFGGNGLAAALAGHGDVRQSRQHHAREKKSGFTKLHVPFTSSVPMCPWIFHTQKYLYFPSSMIVINRSTAGLPGLPRAWRRSRRGALMSARSRQCSPAASAAPRYQWRKASIRSQRSRRCRRARSEENTSEIQSLMRTSYAVF